MNNVFIFSFLVFITFFPFTVFAHPGNTAADGCHYCRTNCDKWGVPWNERHCHGGAATVPQQEVQQYSPPTNTSKPWPTWTPVPTKKPLPTWTPVPTSTPLPTSTPVASITPTHSITPTSQPPTMTVTASPIPTSLPEVKGTESSKEEPKGFLWWILWLFQ